MYVYAAVMQSCFEKRIPCPIDLTEKKMIYYTVWYRRRDKRLVGGMCSMSFNDRATSAPPLTRAPQSSRGARPFHGSIMSRSEWFTFSFYRTQKARFLRLVFRPVVWNITFSLKSPYTELSRVISHHEKRLPKNPKNFISACQLWHRMCIYTRG